MMEATRMIQEQYGQTPRLALVLGSGLGELVNLLENKTQIPYEAIPGFVLSTAPGHAGRLVFGELRGVSCVCMCGRFHYYEGYSPEEVVRPVRLFKELGAEALLLTNAAGGIHTDFLPGDLMLIEDHINLSGMNPLRGKNMESFGPRFPDMSQAYSPGYRKHMEDAARTTGILLRHGVYAMMAGPSFETPAEIRMLRAMGADAVGMSTVPEVITANHCGLPVVGVSCITNKAAGMSKQPLSHQEVLETGERIKGKFMTLIDHFVGLIK